MSKLTKEQKEQLKTCVVDSTIRHLTTIEMQQYVREKMGVDISIDYLWHVKSDIKKDSEAELNLYQKDRFAL
jgi:transposase